MKNAKYILFKPEYGFAQYDPDCGKICYTQQVEAAHEAEKSDWSDVVTDLEAHTFLPAQIYVSQIERHLAKSVEVMKDALDKIETNLDDYAAVEPLHVPLKYHDLKDAQKSLTEAIELAATVAESANAEVSHEAGIQPKTKESK
jgi:hypothetical protein